MVGLDSPLFRGEGGRGGAPEGLQGSGPSSALGGTGRGAGARCALPAVLGGCPSFAPDAFGMPFPPRRTGGSSHAQPLEHSRKRSKCARFRWPADRLERTDALCNDSLVRSTGRAHRAWAGQGGCWRLQPRAACDPARRSRGPRPWLGEGRLADPFLPFLPQLSPLLPQLPVRLLCFPFAAGWVRLLAALAPASSPPGLLLFVRVSFAFPSSLARLPFLLLSGSPGKVASPSLPNTFPTLCGGGWELGVCESAIDPRSSSGLAPAFHRGAGLGAAVSAGLRSRALRGESGGTADRGHPDFPQDPRSFLVGRNSGSPASILSIAPS